MKVNVINNVAPPTPSLRNTRNRTTRRVSPRLYTPMTPHLRICGEFLTKICHRKLITLKVKYFFAGNYYLVKLVILIYLFHCRFEYESLRSFSFTTLDSCRAGDSEKQLDSGTGTGSGTDECQWSCCLETGTFEETGGESEKEENPQLQYQRRLGVQASC